MKHLAQAQQLLKQQPLPDDTPEQLDALVKKANGEEKAKIEYCYEAMLAAATDEQFAKWNGA